MRIDPSTFTLAAKPSFIAFEGINGCGKSTLLNNLANMLCNAGNKVVKTREPGGTPLGLELRKLLLNWNGEKKTARSELLLFGADRAEHCDKVIIPGIEGGSWVLCDRYLYSTIAFQGHGRGISREWIDSANSLATLNLKPDLVILMDVDPEEGLRRTKARKEQVKDSFEEEELAFHHRIRNGFLELAESDAVPFLVLNGLDGKDVNAAKALTVLGVS
jgi:dTMP kinase